MVRVRLASGEEAVFRSVDELALGIQSGVVSADAQVFHGKSAQWLPITSHPEYAAARELASSMVATEDPNDLEPLPTVGELVRGGTVPVYQMVSQSARELAARRRTLNDRIRERSAETVPLPAVPQDPLRFRDSKKYVDRLRESRTKTGTEDAVMVVTGKLYGHDVTVGVQDFDFMAGSLGMAAGQAVITGLETAARNRTPFILFVASGGARMQEGTLSLMQLAKTVAALERLRAAGVPFVSLLSDPTTGGVFASFAVLGDVNLAEPNALIGFAGARVSAGTIAQELPPGFQRSEFLFEHGFLDRVVHRSEMRAEVAALLRYLVPRPAPAHADASDGELLGLPSFRPLSFLTNLAERVLPAEDTSDPPVPPSNGNRPASEAGRPPGASAPGAADPPGAAPPSAEEAPRG